MFGLQKICLSEHFYNFLRVKLVRVGFKIGICGLHYHPSDPFLFHGFFSDPYSPFEIFMGLDNQGSTVYNSLFFNADNVTLIPCDINVRINLYYKQLTRKQQI